MRNSANQSTLYLRHLSGYLLTTAYADLDELHTVAYPRFDTWVPQEQSVSAFLQRLAATLQTTEGAIALDTLKTDRE